MTMMTLSNNIAHGRPNRYHLNRRRRRKIPSRRSMSKAMSLSILCLTVFILCASTSSVNAVPIQAQQQAGQVAIEDLDDGPDVKSLLTFATSSSKDSDIDNAIPAECSHHTNNSRYDPLACWLQHLRVTIPDQSFRSGLITVGIQDLVCTNFSMGGLESTYSPSKSGDSNSTSNNSTDPTMDLSVYNISAVCTGKYSSTGLSGKITTEIAAGNGVVPSALVSSSDVVPALAWTLAVHSTTNNSIHTKAASAVETIQCHTSLQVVSLHFSGTMSAKLVNLFAHTIAKYVTSAINGQLCDVLADQADQQVTAVLQKINHFLDPYLNDTDTVPTTVSASASATVDTTSSLPELSRQLNKDLDEDNYDTDTDGTLVDWATQAPAVLSTLTVVNDFMETYLHAGFLRHWFSDETTTDTVNETESEENGHSENDNDNVPSCRDDDNDCGFVFDGVNGVIRSLLAENAGKFHVPIPNRLFHGVHLVWQGYASIELQLLDLSLTGVDQWDKFMLFRPTPQGQHGQQQQEFESAFRTKPQEALQLQTNVKLIVRPIPDGAFQGDDLTENFQVHLNVSALNAMANLALDMDQFQFQNTNLTVSSVVDVIQGLLSHNASDQLACLLEPIQALTATEFAARMHLDGATFVPVTVADNNKNTDATDTTLVTGKLERDLDALLNNVLQLFLQEYQPLVTNAVYGLTRGPVKDALNKLLTTVTTPTEYCPDPDDTSDDHDHAHLMNFTKVKPLQRLNSFLEQPHTLHKMNAYMECATSFISRALKKRLTSTLTSAVVDTQGISVRLKDIQIDNAGSVRQLQLLSPEGDGMRLHNFLDYGTSDDANRPRIVAAVELSYAPLNLTAVVDVTTLVNDIQLGGGSILHYDTNMLRQLPLAQLMSHVQCGLVPVNEYESYNVQSSIGRFRTTVKASVSCSSMDDPVNLRIDSDRYPVVEVLASSILAWVVNSTRDMGQLASISTLSHAQDMCQGRGSTADADYSEPDEDDDDSQSNLTIFLIVAAIFMLTQPCILLIMRSEEDDENDYADYEINPDALLEPLVSPELVNATAVDAVGISDEDLGPREMVPTLMHNARVPELVRHAIPILIIGCMVLLVSSNLSVGATVNLTVSTGEKVIVNLPSLFAFSLFNTAKEMLQAGIYPLFFLVLIFSGIWPYVKLGLMLFAWSTPKTRLSADNRGSLLLALDALGKFSLVDTYVLVLMLVAFRYHLDLSDDSALDVYVSPQFGFYGFLIATSLSLVLGHLLVYYHRRSEIHLESESTPKERLIEHNFELDDDDRQLSKGFQAVLLATLLATICLLGFGMTQKSFVFEFDGLAGMALGDASRSSYSLLSLGSSLRESVADSSGAGIIGLQVAYYFYAVVTPFCCLVFLLILLIFPMPLKRQLLVLTMAEIANAWSAVEVFALSIVASLLEISTFASFIIGHRCDMIDAILKEFNDNNSNADSGATAVTTCYTVRSFIAGNAVFLVLGVVLYSFIVSTVLGLAHAAVHERIRLFSSKEGRSDQYAMRAPHQPAPRDGLDHRSRSTWIHSTREGQYHGHHHHRNRTWIHWLTRRWPQTSQWMWRAAIDEDDTMLSATRQGRQARRGSTTFSTITLSNNNNNNNNISNGGSSGPPVQGGELTPLSPWQKKDGFAEEWKDAAERDPAWKEWKEATQVT